MSRGILDAHRRGIVTSATLMVNLPATMDAVSRVTASPGLGVGLHLSFCYGPPVGAASGSLVGDDGLLLRDLERLVERIEPQDVEHEARAQLARFIELTGTLPTHVDSHQHVHSWPVCWEPIARLASEYELPVRPATAELATYLQAAGIRSVDYFAGDFFMPGTMSTERLVAVLEGLPPGTSELMCHPGYADAGLADSSFREQREDELAILCSVEVRQLVSRLGIELTTYRSVTP